MRIGTNFSINLIWNENGTKIESKMKIGMNFLKNFIWNKNRTKFESQKKKFTKKFFFLKKLEQKLNLK